MLENVDATIYGDLNLAVHTSQQMHSILIMVWHIKEVKKMNL